MSVSVTRRTVVAVIGDHFKVVQQLLSHGQAVTLRLRLRNERQERHGRYESSDEQSLHSYSPPSYESVLCVKGHSAGRVSREPTVHSRGLALKSAKPLRRVG